MPLLTRYSHLKRKDASNGKLVAYQTARVVGLASELAHKKFRDLGRDHTTEADVSPVSISVSRVSDLEIFDSGAWSKRFKSCELQVRPADARAALAVARAHRAFLGDCDFNIDHLDRFHPALGKGLDMVGEFNRPRYSVTGKVWVETKAYTEADFENKMEKAKTMMEEDFPKLQRRDKSFGAALLLVTKLVKAGGAEWSSPRLYAELYRGQRGQWQDMGPFAGRTAMYGRQGRKPTIAAVWRKMGRAILAESGQEVGFLTHFLRETGRDDSGPGKAAAIFNRILQNAGSAERVEQQEVETHAGQRPYVATKEAFRIILKHM